MTKRREPLTYHRALTLIAARIGWDSCAAHCGVSDRMVRYWSDPDCETEIRLIDAERLDRAFLAAGGDHAPFHKLFAIRLDLAARTPVDNLSNLAAASAKEAGEAISALIEAACLSPSPHAVRRARQEVREAIDILSDTLASLPVDHVSGGAA